MACETITVTNSLSNEICSGEYQKTPEITEWVNTNNPSCKLHKIWNATNQEYEWVFRVAIAPGSTPPPGASKAITLDAPATFTADLKCEATDTRCGGSSVEVHHASLVMGPTDWGSYANDIRRVSWAPHAGSTASYLSGVCDYGYGAPDQYSATSTPFDGQIKLTWSVTGPNPGFQPRSLRIDQTFQDFNSALSDLDNAKKLYSAQGFSGQITFGNSFDFGPGFTKTQNQVSINEILYGADPYVQESWTWEVQDTTNWITSVWKVDDMGNQQTVGGNYWDLFDRNSGNAAVIGNWSAAWLMPTEISTTTTLEETCPTNSNWSGTGLTVTTGGSGGTGPFAINKYYPLYDTAEGANAAGNGTHHTHNFNMQVYYMPNGVQNWHGDWGDDMVDPVPGLITNLTALPDLPGQVEILSSELAPFTGSTETSKYKGYVFNERTNTLSGPFVSEDIRAVTTKDNSAEMYCVNAEKEIKRTLLTDFNDPNFTAFNDPFTNTDQPMVDNEKGVVMSKTGEGFLYRGRYRDEPFADSILGGGEVKNPIFFRDSYLAIAETNWMYLGDEHSEKQFYRVDLRFHKNSCGHLFMYVQSEDGKTKGQYRGMIKEHMKVFTNLRGRGFRICMMVATHKDYPWAMREMAVGYLVGKSF